MTQMKNRIINGIGIAFHSIGFYASAAVIIRMLIAIVMVNKNGSYIRYDATFGDEYSTLLMFLTGFFMYRKHTGLSATVNLSPNKRVITAAISAIFLSAVFSLFDIAMVKEYFSVIKGKTVMLSWEKLFYSVTRSFTGILSENRFLFLLKLTLIYHLFFITGYSLRNIIFTKPSLMIMWVLIWIFTVPFSGIVFVGPGFFSKNSSAALFMMLIMLLPLLAGYIMASPVIFGYCMVLFCMCEDSPAPVVIIILMWLGSIASAARLVSNYKYEIPKEKRKGAIV